MENDYIPIRGFYRLKIGEGPDGQTIVGDSGWCKNEVTDEGFQDYVVGSIGDIAGSKQVAYINLGTGTAPNVTHTALDGSTKAGTCTNSVVASKTLQSTVAFASGDHPGGTPTLQNIALGDTNAATIMCGNTYATSVWNSNQGVSATYQLRFGTA